MADFNFTLKRGVNGADTLYPKTTWTQVADKPATFTPTAHTLTSHSDVTITSPTTGQVLKYNGTAWVNGTDVAGTGDVVGAASSTEGDIVTFSGTTGKVIQGTGLTVTEIVNAIGEKADITHNHAIANVTGLQTALDAKAPLASPTFTGTVTASTIQIPTPSGYHAKMFYGQFPNPAGSLNPASGDSVGLNNFGQGNQGIIIQTGASDTGGLKITDDGVFIFGASDTGLFSIIDEDSNISRFSINSSGNTIVNGTLSVNSSASATSFSGSGASLTSLNGSNISSGTIPTARLGSGTANSTTFLRGDNTWAAASNWTLVKSTQGTSGTSVAHTSSSSSTTITLSTAIATTDILAIEVSSTATNAQRQIVFWQANSFSTTIGSAGINWMVTYVSTTGPRRHYSMDLRYATTTTLTARFCIYSEQAPGAGWGTAQWTGTFPAVIHRIWKVTP
jgi:hypothetical protein